MSLTRQNHRAGTRKQRHIKTQIGWRPTTRSHHEPRPHRTLTECKQVDPIIDCTNRRQRETTIQDTQQHLSANNTPPQDINVPHSSYKSVRHTNTAEKVLKRGEEIAIASWNVRTLNQLGKPENLMQEMQKHEVSIMGVSEARWTSAGKYHFDSHVFIFSGGEKHENGVGIMFDNATYKSVLGYWCLSDRVLLVKLKGSSHDLNLIQVYAPTSDHTDEEVESFYEVLEKAKSQCKSQEITIIMGDFNAKVGSEVVENVVGDYGLGVRNERGETLIEWCKGLNYTVANTWFQDHIRRRWTWQSPGDRFRNQIDYILIPQRFRNIVKYAKTIPKADINSDHRPVKCALKFNLKIKRKKKSRPKKQIELLTKNKEMREQYKREVTQKYDAMKESEDIDEIWNGFTKCITEPIEMILPNRERNAGNKWITPTILEMMDKRSQLERDSIEYKEIDNQIKKDCSRAKTQFIDSECDKIERQKNKNTKDFYESIENLAGKKKSAPSNCIKDSNGNILFENEDILKRWSEYIEQLYSDDNRESVPNSPSSENITGNSIMEEEVAAACKEMKKGKAVNHDEISIELFDALGETGIQMLTKIFNVIYDEGTLPEELIKSTFIAIPKKSGAIECDQHRTISIMSQATKILLRIIMKRIRNKLSPQIGKEQFGFVKEKGTVNAIFTLKSIIQRSIEKQKELFLCFIDYKKAFDSVLHTALFEMLNAIGIDEKDLRLVRYLYWNQSACVKLDDETSDYFDIKKGVRQGCVLSPDLFNLYSEAIFHEIDETIGVQIGGTNITNIRYADDAVLMAFSVEDLQQMLDKLIAESESKGLLLNVKKTVCMGIHKSDEELPCQLFCNGEQIKQVNQFCYLGATITSDGKDISEVKRRIAQARQTFHRMRPILSNRKLSLSTRLQVAQTYVLSTLMYACETWTLDAICRHRLEAFELWMYRRILNIPWTARLSNTKVLEKIGRQRELLSQIRKKQMSFFGHVWRQNGLEKLAASGFIEGKRAPGRQRTTFVTALRQATSEVKKNNDFTRLAEDRQLWRTMIGKALPSASHPG